MAKEGLQFTIKARDESKKVLQGVLGDIRGFSRTATSLITAPFRALTSIRWAGLQANVNMLRGLGAQMDAVIERGTRLGVVSKSFESLTGRTGASAKRLTKEIQDASHGMLTLARSQEIANRALASGLTSPQLKTALDFISRKAVTTGKEVGSALDTVITGLSRGSTLFLDDFGVLVDGVDQVKRDFDRIKGSGAFDSLGPAAQKAAIIEAAIADMRKQMSAIGVVGDEAVFQWAKIKTSIADSTDRLIAAATASKGLQSFLGDVSKVVSGVADSLGGPDQDQAFTGIWESMKGGAAAILGDIGELLIGPMMDGLGKVATYFGDLLLDVADRFIGKIISAAAEVPFLKNLMPQSLIDKAGEALNKPRLTAPSFGSGGAPFHRTQGWWRDTAQRFGGMGQDAMERKDAELRARLTPGERRRLEVDLIQERRQRSLLDDEDYKRTIFQEEGKRRLAEDVASKPEWARSTGAERRGRMLEHAAEARENEIKNRDRRIREIEERLGPRDTTRESWEQRTERVKRRLGLKPLDVPDDLFATGPMAGTFGGKAWTDAAAIGVPASQPAAALGVPASQPAAALAVQPVMPSVATSRPAVSVIGSAPTSQPAMSDGDAWAVQQAKNALQRRRGFPWGKAMHALNRRRHFDPTAAAEAHLGVPYGTSESVGVAVHGSVAGFMAGAMRGAQRGTIGGLAGAGIGALIGGGIAYGAPMLGRNVLGWLSTRGGEGQSSAGVNRAAGDINDGSRALVASAQNYREAARRSEQAARELAAVVALV